MLTHSAVTVLVTRTTVMSSVVDHHHPLASIFTADASLVPNVHCKSWEEAVSKGVRFKSLVMPEVGGWKACLVTSMLCWGWPCLINNGRGEGWVSALLDPSFICSFPAVCLSVCLSVACLSVCRCPTMLSSS